MTKHRWSLALWTACALGVGALFVWCLALPGRTPPVAPEGDPAIIELYTWHASHGLWAYGPYSRFGWHHPGPLYFYLLAPFYAASGHHTLSLNAGALVINIAAVTIAGWCLVRYASGPLGVAVLAALSLYVYEMARLLTSLWNPHVLLLPFAALLLTAAVVSAGELSMLPLMVLLASFAAQTHVGLVPCVAAVSGIATACGAVRTIRAGRASRVAGPARGPRLWIGGSALLLVVLWLPPLIEQVKAPASSGNFSAMLHFFGPSGPREAEIARADAVSLWSATLTAPVRFNVEVPWGNAIARVRHNRVVTTLAIIEILLLALAAWWFQRTRRIVDARLAALCALASIVAFYSVAHIRGGIADHLVAWVTVVGVLNAAVLISAMFTWIDERRLPRLRVSSSLTTPIVAIGCLVLVLAVGLYGAMRIEHERQEVVRKSVDGRTPPQALYQELRSTLTKARIRKPLIRVAAFAWPQAAAVILQLTKKDFPFSTDEAWMFGPQFAPRGDEDGDVTIADGPTRQQLAQRPGDCMLLERHGASVHVLAVPPERFVSVTCVAP